MFHVKHTDNKKAHLVRAGLLDNDPGLCSHLHSIAMQQILNAIVYERRIIAVIWAK